VKRFRSFFLVIALLVFGISFFALNKSPSKESSQSLETRLVKFAIISDIHSHLDNLQRALLLIKEGENDFFIVTGDLTSLGKEEELKEVKKLLDKSSLRYYAIPGNHDLWVGEKLKTDIYGQVFGPDYQSFKEGEIKFILMNNGSYQGMDKKQEEWVSGEVSECLSFYCLVFMHIPLNHPKSIYVMGEENSMVASQAARLVKLLTENKVKEAFAGHLHASSFYTYNGLTTSVVGAITGVRNFESPKYLEVTVLKKGGEIILEKKEIFLHQ
jgi:predicted MPP superfamily phosphohydrolase